MPKPNNDTSSLQHADLLGMLRMTEIRENDSDGRPLYIGYALPGSSTSAEVWLIYKMAYDANGFLNSITYPSAKAEYIFAWTSRATYSYS